jgi:N-methylhydantoinase A
VTYHIGIDVGGTFTDCVAIGADGQVHHAKTLSTRDDPTNGMLAGLARLAADQGRTLEHLLRQVTRLAHGTTIGTNLVLERRGAKVGLICTIGHRDAILMMRGTAGAAGKAIEAVYRVHEFRAPDPLVPRRSILEIEERIDCHGDIVVRLDPIEARQRIAAWLEANDFDAVAISLLWSFRNPVHERALGKIVQELAPELFVSLSSSVAPRVGEYERTVATVINAYVGPASSVYLAVLEERLRAAGFGHPVLVMQSNGGVVPAARARAQPFTTIDSGPTGGLAGAAGLARVSGHTNVIATDMGGTSFDVGLVFEGEPLLADERTIGPYTYRLAHLDVRSIGCGGGSIAHVDLLTRSIRVGPESAGSEPGPACYGRGGSLPTVTDADVVLGLLRPDAFLGGRMQLDEAAARGAIEPLARQVGLSIEEAASGIVRINNANAALLIRQRTLEQGLDPRDFVVYAFGGAGPVHAFDYAAELGVTSVVIPLGNGASTFSAYGIATADALRYFERECTLRGPFDPASLAEAVGEFEASVRRELAEEGFEVLSVERTLLMRYVGQFLQSIPVRIADGPIDRDETRRILDAFERHYERQFGAGARIVFQSVEAFAIRLKVLSERGTRPAAPHFDRAADQTAPRLDGHKAFWPQLMRRLPTPIVDGMRLGPSETIEGPSLVELPHTTVAVAPGQALRMDRAGSLVLLLRH